MLYALKFFQINNFFISKCTFFFPKQKKKVPKKKCFFCRPLAFFASKVLQAIHYRRVRRRVYNLKQQAKSDTAGDLFFHKKTAALSQRLKIFYFAQSLFACNVRGAMRTLCSVVCNNFSAVRAFVRLFRRSGFRRRHYFIYPFDKNAAFFASNVAECLSNCRIRQRSCNSSRQTKSDTAGDFFFIKKPLHFRNG